MFDEIKNKILKDEILKSIKKIAAGDECFLAGGYIRDIFFGKISSDYDIVVKFEHAREFSEKLSKELAGKFIPLDEENNIYRIVLQDKIHYIDVSGMLDNDIEKDVKRRDLTINSVIFDLNKEKFIDLEKGIEDLKKGVLRTARKENFIDDPLRMLRVFRFCAQTGFEPDKEILDFIKENGEKINFPAKERVNTEILKLFEGKYSGKSLKIADKTGLLEFIFPILSEIKKIPPNSHHHLDLFHHSVETQDKIEELFESSEERVRNVIKERKALLKLAGFLHDAGKPSVMTIEPDTGRHRFIRHDEVGSEIVVPLLKELKFSKKQIKYISFLVRNHIYPSQLVSSEHFEKAEFKFFAKSGEFVPDVILLAKADRLSALGPAITPEIVKNNISNLTKLLNKYFENIEKTKPPKPFLNGHEISAITGIAQSKELGDIVKKIYENQVEGIIATKEEAVKFLQDNYLPK